ncbi:phage integrase SAM-like domain-containing protein [Prevotella sp. HUN102]|uniref:phage integrase SAM-like domain-containing protein n=1 Tax=Prevotella sp. HUN102 TaxID=1392486 RepID=UPI0004919F58|nr:phage integrase SAM-like domain-containing protein [Prevotella sp. HUN102]
MATFKATIFKDRQRSDKTWNVVIRFTHDRKVRYLSTTMYVTKKDITASYKIKNADILDRCNDLIKVYRERVNELDLEFNEIDIDTIISYLKQKKENNGVSFTDFAHKWMAKHTEIKGMKNYKTSLNSFCAFMGRDNILCDEITVKIMKAFEEALKGRPRAQSLYPNCIVRIFNEARDYYNDEDNDIIRIKHSLRKYKPVEQNVAEKRALDVETIRKIFSLPYSREIQRNGKLSKRNLALDCFRLSFGLMGMNSADLYNATDFDGKTITYNRMKTKDRRSDKAEIRVDVHSSLVPLVEKYQGEGRVFNFFKRFSTMESFNKAINSGLKSIGEELGVERLQFYAARHSFATIAVNDVGISKYVVNDMLNHIDPALKVTELYIRKDFKAINDANVKVLDYVLNEN